jgi:hypothetical protein
VLVRARRPATSSATTPPDVAGTERAPALSGVENLRSFKALSLAERRDVVTFLPRRRRDPRPPVRISRSRRRSEFEAVVSNFASPYSPGPPRAPAQSAGDG